MFANAPGVPAAPPTSGLVASAVRPTIDRWEQGLAWIPERCGAGYQLVPWCDEPNVGAYTPPRPGAAYYRPVGLRVADQCSTLGGQPDLERARRVADATAPFAVARELWAGTGAQADTVFTIPNGGGTDRNPWLASSEATTVAGTHGARVGIGRLEQAALEATRGQPVFLHVPVTVLPQLDGYVVRVGSTLVTLAGNVLVADGGYPGTGPAGQTAGATVWAYATPPVSVLMSPWALVTDDPSTVDRAKNTRTTWASRVIAATYDPCVHLTTQITL